MGVLQTEFEFSLPAGYLDEEGTLHKNGAMRLATAGDEIFPWKDPRTRNNERYYDLIFLARVVVRLGTLPTVTPDDISRLFIQDFHYLKRLAVTINQADHQTGHEESPALDQIYEEVTFLAYFLHWDYSTLMDMDHRERQRWCKDLSELHLRMNQEQARVSGEKSILEV